MTWVNAVSPGWFRTYGIRMAGGRDFTAADKIGIGAGRRCQSRVRPPLSDEQPARRARVGTGSVRARRHVRDRRHCRGRRLSLAPFLDGADAVPPRRAVGSSRRNNRNRDPRGRRRTSRPHRSVAAAFAGVEPDAALTCSSLAERVNGSLTRSAFLPGCRPSSARLRSCWPVSVSTASPHTTWIAAGPRSESAWRLGRTASLVRLVLVPWRAWSRRRCNRDGREPRGSALDRRPDLWLRALGSGYVRGRGSHHHSVALAAGWPRPGARHDEPHVFCARAERKRHCEVNRDDLVYPPSREPSR